MMFTQQCWLSFTALVAFDVAKLNSVRALNKTILIYAGVFPRLVGAEHNPVCELNCPHLHLSHVHLQFSICQWNIHTIC